MTVSKLPVLAAALTVFAAPLAMADCALNYEQFEVGVPHTDLEACPSSMAEPKTYCRLSMVAETVTVFAFSQDTDCIVATRVFSDENYTLVLK